MEYSATVDVNDPRQPEIDDDTGFVGVADPVTPNTIVTLTWMVMHAASVTITDNHGGIALEPFDTDPAGSATDTVMVRPTQTTDYTLTAIGERDTDKVSKTIRVEVEETDDGFMRTVQ